VETGDAHRLGYERVDQDPNVSVLLDTMDTTGEWEATRRLRAWEQQRLNLSAGDRILDVGCGLGDAILRLALDVGDEGEAVGIDASNKMISVARERARASGFRLQFSVGDAHALDQPDDHFDAVRSERTLQWLADPAAAVAEMWRVLRPGGIVSLIDTDWSTFAIDVGDGDVTERVRSAMRTERRRPSNIGGRLAEVVHRAGFESVAQTHETETWNTWDPDASPAPRGCFSMSSLADDLVEAGHLERCSHDRFVSTIHDAAASRCRSRCSRLWPPSDRSREVRWR
jgi:SAM-dependent methyltransferase